MLQERDLKQYMDTCGGIMHMSNVMVGITALCLLWAYLAQLKQISVTVCKYCNKYFTYSDIQILLKYKLSTAEKQ